MFELFTDFFVSYEMDPNLFHQRGAALVRDATSSIIFGCPGNELMFTCLYNYIDKSTVTQTLQVFSILEIFHKMCSWEKLSRIINELIK